MVGEDYTMLAKSVSSQVRMVGRGKPVRLQPMMKNVNDGKGVFAPIVVLARNVIGKKRFNQIRGKAIALHSQVRILLLFLHNFVKSFLLFRISFVGWWKFNVRI